MQIEVISTARPTTAASQPEAINAAPRDIATLPGTANSIGPAENDVGLYDTCTGFIEDSFTDISWLNNMEWGAFGVAIALLIASGAVAIYKEWKKPVDTPQDFRAEADPNSSTFVQIIKALPELIKALSSAPAAVVLVVLGLLLVWAPQQEVEVPEICERVIEHQHPDLPKPQRKPTPQPKPTATPTKPSAAVS